MAVPLSFLHSPVTPVGTGRTYQLDRCSPDYTPQDGHVNLSGEDNSLTGESYHDLLDYLCKSSWGVTAARSHPAHPPRRLLGLFHVFRPICLAACLGHLAFSSIIALTSQTIAMTGHFVHVLVRFPHSFQ
ncbi:hypothetical protein PVAP13_9NG390946 [Panicum virgatum]|uniref:Uncharacterized protein n=1 Tax=Panicum virgatum TaxID=38727 RepID=A0A8T0MLK3_PANVG|nr:hypothetical protein PVAP13_9NG390946 [Panicum virgatum]